MRLNKQITPPEGYRRRIRRTLSLFSEKEGALVAKNALHLRAKCGTLVCTNGSKRITSLSSSAKLFFGNYSNRLYCYHNGTVYLLNGSALTSCGTISEATAFIEIPSLAGEVLYAISKSGLYRGEEGEFSCVPQGAGGDCLAYHYERLFVADGDTLRFSAPLNADDWAQSLQGAGYVQLPSEGGKAVALVSYKEKLYLFRERAIMQIRALGDTLNFKATTVPYSCGKILQNSVVNCGKEVYFCTDEGFYSFNGAYAKRVGGSYPVTLGKSNAVCLGGKYLIAAETEEKERVVFAYDGEDGAYLTAYRANALAGGSEGYYVSAKGGLYRITGQGFPARDERTCLYESEYSTFGLSVGNKRLRAIFLEGEGKVELSVRSDFGEEARVKGNAGKEIRLPRAVRGNAFSLKITSFDETVRLTAATFELFEEKKYGY